MKKQINVEGLRMTYNTLDTVEVHYGIRKGHEGRVLTAVKIGATKIQADPEILKDILATVEPRLACERPPDEAADIEAYFAERWVG